MIGITLEKLIGKKEIKTQINQLCTLSKEPLSIYNWDGKKLMGDGENNTLTYPISVEGEVLGYVKGSDEVQTIANLLSYMCSKELANKALGQELLDKYRETAILYDITEKLATRLNSREVVQLILKEVKHLIKADHASVMFYDEQEGLLQQEIEEEERNGKLSFHIGEGIAGSVVASGKAEIINDTKTDPRFIRGHYTIGSMMCAPLCIQDKVIGVINACVETPYQYTANDLKILSTLAFQASIAIENARLFEQLEDAFLAMVYTLSETIDKRDTYTGGHTKRVMCLSMAIGDRLKLGEEDRERLRLGAILHDIGKIGIRDDVLLKATQLTNEEYEQIKKHTIWGYEIIRHIKYLQGMMPAVRHHHERYDGKGYPDQVAGEAIDIIARIIAVADSYDAMISDRPYRKGLDSSLAVEELKKHADKQFDRQVVEAFVEAYNQGKIARKVDEEWESY